MAQLAQGRLTMPAVRRNHRRWTVWLVAMWAGLIAWSNIESLRAARIAIQHERAPATRWLDVRSVRVSDAIAGECPTMTVDRTIHQRVRGSWVATLRKRGPSGGFSAYRSATGTIDYQPGTAFPEPLFLWWWMEWPPDECQLEPGDYIVTTQWLLSPPGYPTKEEFEPSNVFTIRPR